MTTRTADNSQILDAYIAQIAVMRYSLAVLQAYADDDGTVVSDAIQWGHVREIQVMAQTLRDLAAAVLNP